METTRTHLQEFLRIAKELNKRKITPLLMGSVGLEVLTQMNWSAQDIDIHVPGDARGWEIPAEQRIKQWAIINQVMTELGYQLVDLHEHEFHKKGRIVQFGSMDSLPAFAGFPLADLEEKKSDTVRFYLPTATQYLKIYQASAKDNYRKIKTNDKDGAKIAFLQAFIADHKKA